MPNYMSSGRTFGQSLSVDLATLTSLSARVFGSSPQPQGSLNRARPMAPLSPTRSRPMSCLFDASKLADTAPKSNCLSAFAFPDSSIFEFADLDEMIAQFFPE